jgi:hypothetical protein
MVSDSSLEQNFSLRVQPPLAWMAILGLVLFSAACLLSGAGGILRLVFPLLSFAVGVFLYLRYPTLYIGFTCWLWILTPLVARLIDYRSGWDPQRLLMVSPYLVTLITFATFFRYFPSYFRQVGLPFVLAFAGVFYSFLIGLITNPPASVARSLLDWLTPIIFGFYFLVHWRDYPQYRESLRRTFLWGVLITGVYGVYQYLVAPEWDRFWLIHSGMTSSNGSPEPLGIRVWSTMNSAGTFGIFMMAGLILLFSSRDALRFPAAIFGYLAFLLSLVRSAWGGWLAALIILVASLKSQMQIRLIVTIFAVGLCALPVATMEPFAKVIGSRFESLANLQEDSSFNDRSELFTNKIQIALSTGLGKGLGGGWVVDENTGAIQTIVLDSGILDIFFTLGWFGAIPYLGGLFLLLARAIQGSEGQSDTFISAARAVGIAGCTQLIFFNAAIGFGGLIIWGFLGITLAGQKYHQQI